MTQRAKRNTSSTVCRLSRAVAVRNSPARAISLYQVYLGEFYRSVAVQERDPLGDSQPYSKGDFQIVVSHYDTATLRSDYPNVLQWAVDLTYNSIGKLYEQTWGWDSDRKLEELAHSDSRHLLAQQYTSGSRIPVTVAYMCYRWEHDPLEEECRDDEQPVPVAYVYELQVDPCAQGKGIGPHLMHVLERMARRLQMDKVMLTCFKNNTGALKMYRKLEYLIDDSSPASDIDDPDLQGYYIMSKEL